MARNIVSTDFLWKKTLDPCRAARRAGPIYKQNMLRFSVDPLCQKVQFFGAINKLIFLSIFYAVWHFFLGIAMHMIADDDQASRL
jgi:hypothetical protein